MPRGSEPAREREDLSCLFVERVNAGDIDGLAALYEHDAVLALPDGVSLRVWNRSRAWLWFVRRPPDLVLVDVHLPGVDGIELTRRIRASERAPVFVLISTEDPSRLPAAARSCGAAAVISKHELAPARLRQLWQAHGQPTAE